MHEPDSHQELVIDICSTHAALPHEDIFITRLPTRNDIFSYKQCNIKYIIDENKVKPLASAYVNKWFLPCFFMKKSIPILFLMFKSYCEAIHIETIYVGGFKTSSKVDIDVRN